MKKQLLMTGRSRKHIRLIAILYGILHIIGPVAAQQLQFAVEPTMQIIKINGLGSTICQPSSANISTTYHSIFSIPQDLTTWISTNEATYHTAEAGYTDTIILDIPDVGLLDTLNKKLYYRYGINNGTYTEVTVDRANSSPSGYFRFKMPVKFQNGTKQAYLAFRVFDKAAPIVLLAEANLVVIPIAVTGATVDFVDSLGIITQPQIPYLILHAPPGDMSSSEFQKTKITCREFTDTYAEDNSNSANVAVKVGIAGDAGFILTAPFEFSVTVKAGATLGDLIYRKSATQTCVETTAGFSANSLSGDVFIGYGQDVAYGITPTYKIDSNTCSLILDTTLIYGYRQAGKIREFAYTKSGILGNIQALNSIVADSNNVGPKVANNAQNQIDVWNQVLALNDSNVMNPGNEVLSKSISFNSGVRKFQQSTITLLETNSFEVEHYIDVNAGVEAVIEFGGSGVTGGHEYKSSKRFGKTQNQTEEGAQLVRFELFDDDTAGTPDLFNLEVVRDPMYGTPIFRLLEGTKSSCPYQGGVQRDMPKLEIVNQVGNSIAISGAPLELDSAAIFQIKLCNLSNETRDYNLELDDNSNENGARVFASGEELNQPKSVTLDSMECKTYTIEVKRLSINSNLSYPNLELVLYPECEPSISSSIFASVYFGTSAVHEQSPVTLFNVFPNPTSGDLTAEFSLEESADVRFELYDMVGSRTVIASEENFAAGPHRKAMNVEQLPSGIYQLAIKTNQSVMSKKVIIQH